MVDDLRYKRLVHAKALALEGNFKDAYGILDGLYRKYPQDLEVHRLYGNVLELDAFSFEVTNPMDERLRRARRHYAFILRVSNYDRVAMFDLAEHFSNIEKVHIAKCFYEEIVARYKDEASEEVGLAKEWLDEMKEKDIESK